MQEILSCLGDCRQETSVFFCTFSFLPSSPSSPLPFSFSLSLHALLLPPSRSPLISSLLPRLPPTLLPSRRQEELEAKLVEEETAKRVEQLVAERVQQELERRKDEIEAEVLRRVEEAKKVGRVGELMENL